MNELKKLLSEGDADRAVGRFAALLKHEPANAGPLARQVTALLIDRYDHYDVAPVHRFCQVMPERVAPQVTEAMMTILGPHGERTRHWMQELEAVTRERLAREARAAVTTNDPKRAASIGVTLIGRGRTAADTRNLARYYCEALASLRRDVDRSVKIVREVARDGSIKEMGIDLLEFFEKAKSKQHMERLEESDRDWTQALNGATISVAEFCPGRREVGEPTDEALKRLSEEFRGILCAGLASGREEDFIDALTILSEFCPVDPQEVKSLAGVEARMFLSLGPRAKLAVVRTLGRLGENETLRERVIALARSPAARGRVALLATVMGALRRVEFYPWLAEAMKRAKTQAAQEPLVDALGRIADPAAAELLCESLKRAVKKSLDPKEARRARMLLTALGRLTRVKTLGAEKRNAIVGRTIEIIGERAGALGWPAARSLFTSNVGAIKLALRQWAARQALRAMFHVDSGEDLRAASRSPLGFRQPMVATLGRLGKECLPIIVEEASHHAMNYSGALKAFAELMEKVGDASALSVLDAMIRTAMTHEEGDEKSALLREQFQDAATGEMRDLDRDDIVHSLLYALDKIGGDPGVSIILGYADQVQAGQVASPGKNTASFLMQAKSKHGTLGRREAPSDSPAASIDEKEIGRAAAQAKGGLFAKPRKQIEALAVLGRARRAETLGAILQCIGSKEAMVLNAAETALIQFVTPPPSPKAYERLIAAMLTEKKGLSGKRLQAVLEIIAKHFPKNSPYDKVFQRAIKIELEEGELAYRLLAAIGHDANQPAASGEGKAGAEETERTPLPSAAGNLDLLTQKRDYMEKRRAWIKAGKQGPAPKPPRGMG